MHSQSYLSVACRSAREADDVDPFADIEEDEEKLEKNEVVLEDY